MLLHPGEQGFLFPLSKNKNKTWLAHASSFSFLSENCVYQNAQNYAHYNAL